jgi:SAM-dependent methyltransferase
MADLGRDDVSRINVRSDDYFADPSRETSWVNKPLSEARQGPDNLWRFGLLLSALQVGGHDRVLDFGCGTGWTSALMARTGAEVTGIDISAHAIRIANEGTTAWVPDPYRARLRFGTFDGEHIDAPDGYYDVIVIFDALHHLPNPVRVLSECFRVLGPHGRVGFAEPGAGHESSHTAERERSHGILENEIDPEALRRSAHAVGFVELDLIVPPVPPSLLTLPMPRARWFLRGVPWIVPLDYVRAAILASPIGVIRKSPYTSTTLNPYVLLATLRPSDSVLRSGPNDRVMITCSVQNPTGTVWLAESRRGAGATRLSAAIISKSDGALVCTWAPIPLPADLLQTGEVVLRIAGEAPSSPGEYVLRLDMSVEGIGSFSDWGSPPVDLALRVSA